MHFFIRNLPQTSVVAASARGFTLIELMITMAMVGILTAIAVPAYGVYVQRAARAEGRSVLLESAQFMQRFYSDNNQYAVSLAGVAVSLPAALRTSPRNGQAVRYNLDIPQVDAVSFTVRAVPVGAQAGDNACGTLTLTNTGARGATGATTPAAVADCWK